MITYEDECVDCVLPCLGSTCPKLNVKHYYCDDCGCEEDLYYFDGEMLCSGCVLKRLEKVED